MTDRRTDQRTNPLIEMHKPHLKTVKPPLLWTLQVASLEQNCKKTDGWKDGWTNARTDRQRDRWIDKQKDQSDKYEQTF